MATALNIRQIFRSAAAYLGVEVRSDADTAGPTITSGSVAPSAAEPDGSGYLGSIGLFARLYSAWFAVPFRLFAQTAASTAISNTVTETVFTAGVYSIPASLLTAGRSVRVTYQGIVTGVNATPTLAINLIIGGSEVNATGTVLIITSATVAATDTFSGSFILTARAAPGASAACVGSGSCTIGVPGTSTVKASFLASTNLATNAALPVKISATWGAAHASNSCRLDQFVVEAI